MRRIGGRYTARKKSLARERRWVNRKEKIARGTLPNLLVNSRDRDLTHIDQSESNGLDVSRTVRHSQFRILGSQLNLEQGNSVTAEPGLSRQNNLSTVADLPCYSENAI